jgi:hypothetical protein
MKSMSWQKNTLKAQSAPGIEANTLLVQVIAFPKIPSRVVPLSGDNKTEWASLAALNFMLPANFAFLV